MKNKAHTISFFNEVNFQIRAHSMKVLDLPLQWESWDVRELGFQTANDLQTKMKVLFAGPVDSN